MPGPHVFVDETKARGYLVAAAVMNPAALAAARKRINGLRLPGQRRIHFAHESGQRRRSILTALGELGARAIVYDARSVTSGKDARDTCMRAIVNDCAAMGAALLVVEQDDSVMKADRQVIRAQTIAAGCAGQLEYRHLRAYEEPVLAIPDAIAWCWARGGDWQRRAAGLVTQVRALKTP